MERADFDKLLGAYIALRDKRDAIKKKQSEELRPYTEALGKAEAKFLQYMNESQINSIGADSGTAYRASRVRAKVEDWSVALPFIIENELWSMLTSSVSKEAVEGFMESNNGALPPGITTNTEHYVNVRRK